MPPRIGQSRVQMTPTRIVKAYAQTDLLLRSTTKVEVGVSQGGTGLLASLKSRLTPGFHPGGLPYAECSIMPSTRLYASVRLVNRAISCARLGIIQGLSRIIQELSRLAILATGENNNALRIRERCQLTAALL